MSSLSGEFQKELYYKYSLYFTSEFHIFFQTIFFSYEIIYFHIVQYNIFKSVLVRNVEKYTLCYIKHSCEKHILKINNTKCENKDTITYTNTEQNRNKDLCDTYVHIYSMNLNTGNVGAEPKQSMCN